MRAHPVCCICPACRALHKRAQAAIHLIRDKDVDPHLALYEVVWPGRKMKQAEKEAA